MVGIFLFLLLYFYSAEIYPGGTKLDHSSPGYSHLRNYWCDLLDTLSYCGKPNPGYHYALAGNTVLSLSMIFFWYSVPKLFVTGAWKRWVVQASGFFAMIFSALVFTRLHDFMINGGALFGTVAFVTTQAGLYQNRCYGLFSFSFVAIALGLANYFMWQLGYRLELIPLVQKGAFVSFFIWVGSVSMKVLKRD